MLEMLFSGKFPSARHRNTYTEDLQNIPADPGTHEDRARNQQIKVKSALSPKLPLTSRNMGEAVAAPTALVPSLWRRWLVSSSMTR